jgi:hypothetical protein
MPSENTTGQKSSGLREGLSRVKRKLKPALFQGSNGAVGSQDQSPGPSGSSSAANLEPSPSPSKQASTPDVTVSSGLPLLPGGGPAQTVSLDLSNLSIHDSTGPQAETTSDRALDPPREPTPIALTSSSDLLNQGSATNESNPLQAAHLTGADPNPSASTATQTSRKTIWDQACDRLDPKEKAFIQEHVITAVRTHTDFQIVLKAVQEKKQTCQEGRWKFSFKGHEVVLCDVADRVCGWLKKLEQIGNITVSVDPLHAGLPWAGIRLLLQVRPFFDLLHP